MPDAAPPPRPTTWKAALTGLLLFLAVDALLFRVGPYGYLAKPDSSAGWSALRCLDDELMLPRSVDVAVFGDSRIGDAFSPEAMQADWPGRSVTTRSEEMPGSTPRVWSYLLERLDPAGGRYRVAVFGLADYDDCDDLTDHVLDLSFLAPLLPLSATIDLASSYDDPDLRREAVLTALFKSYAWRRDVQDFAATPLQRYLDVRRRFGSYYWDRPYLGQQGSLAGVRVEGDRIAGLPPGTPRSVENTLQRLAFDAAPAPSASARAYNARWLGRIAAHEAGTRTRVVFVRLPTQLLPRQKPAAAAAAPSDTALAALARQPHVHVLDRELFAELERPEFFYDAVHLNTQGRARFTAILGAELRRRFGEQLQR